MTRSRGKQLYYFTTSYPWGMGFTWKANELVYLREYFDCVTVVPYCYEDNFHSPKPLPEGVSAVEPLFREGTPKIELRTALEIIDRHAGYYATELARKRPFSNRAQLGAWLGASIQTSRLLRHPVIRRIMNAPDPDTSLCFFWGRGACDFLPFVDKRRFRSVIVRFHRYDLFEDENSGYMPYRRQLLESTTIAAPSSEKGVRHLRSLYPDLTKSIRLARLGVPRLPELAMSSDGVLRVLSCSFVTPRKRVDLIADALREVRFPVHWTHVGDGPDMKALRAQVARLPSNVETYLPGNVAADELFKFYQQRPVDVFVNVSTSEGIAMTILECLSAGVPVFATDVGGSSEVVDQTVGLLLPADVTARQLAAELERFHALPTSEKRLRREAAVRRHRERSDVEVLTRELARQLLEPGA
ncbi:MAG TPA: glycosyltransferase [Polyangiaceae bacterium]|nr:glycosyltransferase [Polyangiaceae bacterium]